jgi:hypothetical protein
MAGTAHPTATAHVVRIQISNSELRQTQLRDLAAHFRASFAINVPPFGK